MCAVSSLQAKSTIRDMRYPVEMILDLLASGMKFLVDAQLPKASQPE
ncbi:MAG: DUF433 domain-containing protein [Bacteroidales bacterium]